MPLNSQSMGRASAAIACVLLFGCGDDRPATFPTTGRVVFSDGQPVRTGTVELFSDEHQLNATGTIRNNGSFLLGTFSENDGACAGSHRAIVTQMIISDLQTKHILDHGAPVDPVFGSYTTSPLTVTIRADGPNEITLTVEKAPKKQ